MKILLYHCLEMLSEDWINLITKYNISTFLAIDSDDVLRIINNMKIDIAVIRLEPGFDLPVDQFMKRTGTRFYLIDESGKSNHPGPNVEYIPDSQSLGRMIEQLHENLPRREDR